MPLTLSREQVEMLQKLEEYLPQDGSADECHRYYCPYNVSAGAECTGQAGRGYLHFEGYDGDEDGFDSECPRFVPIDRDVGKWDCLCGLAMVATAMGVPLGDLRASLAPFYEEGEEILGHDPRPEWQHEGVPGKFVPISPGCDRHCAIQEDTETCCSSGRTCCYHCLDECPVKEKYNIPAGEE